MLAYPITPCNKRPRNWKVLSVRSTAIVVLAGLAPLSLLAQEVSSAAASNQQFANSPDVAANTLKASGMISGTVLDTNGNVIRGARVVLTGPAKAGKRVMQSGANGEFTFSELPSGSFTLTVTGTDMGAYVTPEILIHAGETRFVSGVVLPVATADTEVRVSGDQNELAQEQFQIAVDQRLLGILPNFYSSYDWNAPPMRAKQKLLLGLRSVTDPVAFVGAGILAGMEQANNTFPGYGQGAQGYAKRYGATYTNDASGRILSSAVFPSLLHQDPRYFYKGTGSILSRSLYAVGATIICRGDNGRSQPNYSHVLGTFAAGGLSNLYYPAASRGVSLVFINGSLALTGHAGNNLLREFFWKKLTSKVPNYSNGKP
ncbi:MAG TPA: carboxypeptidase-like regulatory domain-containing protein [Terracidiphilus sp.]|nr:carboxypeptidase-like regulatory domain-containing protein [Terracidiphilus sp.]